MALPVLLWGAAAALGATGVVKGAGAVSNLKKAKEIGERAERNYDHKTQELDETRDATNACFEDLGRLKVEIFSNQIKHIVRVLHEANNQHAKSHIIGFNSEFTVEELMEMERMVEVALDLDLNAAGSLATGALAGLGVYGAVPMIGALASTGTAISTLSGAAATNATLAWLGGGSLAAGGFGIAGGSLALAGIVAGPALAVGGFMLASKAEEALTEARRYRSKVREAIAEMDLVKTNLMGLQTNAHEIEHALVEMVDRFEQVRVDSFKEKNFHAMLMVGKALKELMNTPIMQDDGSPVANIKETCDGYLVIEMGES